MFWLITLAWLGSIAAASYAGSHYGAKAGAAVAALEGRLKAIEAKAVADVKNLEGKL